MAIDDYSSTWRDLSSRVTIQKAQQQTLDLVQKVAPANEISPSENKAKPRRSSSSSRVGRSRKTVDKAPATAGAWDELKQIQAGLAQIKGEIQSDFKEVEAGWEKEWPLLYDHGEVKVRIMSEDLWDKAENWFFIGDVHGDFFALHTILAGIEKMCPDFRICFLGDLVDRGPHPVECLVLLMKWACRYQERFLWIAGNHDVSLSFDTTSQRFCSAVEPSEFCDWLNDGKDLEEEVRREIGRLFISVASRLPVGVLFPDGLLATHGGFPLSDQFGAMKALDHPEERFCWMNSPGCLEDFTWTRISRYKKKIPNRNTHGCSYGYQDFEDFCNAVGDFFPVKRMITGHEHPESGGVVHETYTKNPAITLRGFGFHPSKPGPDRFNLYLPKLVAARGKADLLPEIVEFDYDPNEMRKFYPSSI